MVTDKEPDKSLKTCLRKKYADDGISAFCDKELIELLLTYSTSSDYEKNAELLSESYSSLIALIDADSHTLVKLMGKDDKFAVLLKLIPQLSRIYFMENRRIKCLDSTKAAIKYFESFFIGAAEEEFAVVCTDENFVIKDTKIIAKGGLSSVDVSMREIADFVMKRNAVHIFAAHNHPSGDALPSAEDFYSTDMIFSTLERLGIILVDHIIIGKGVSVSMRELPYYQTFRRTAVNGYAHTINTDCV